MEWQAFFQACRGEVEFIAPDVEVFDRVTDESKGSALIAQLPDDFLVVSEDLAMVVSDALVHVVVGSQGALARFLGDSLSALGPLLDRWRRDTKKYSVEARITERIIDHTKPRWLMGFHPAFPN